MEGSSIPVTTLPGALAVLGALGSDAMGSVMISQCLNPQSYNAETRVSQILDGACQPMVGPTFKLGAMLTVHTACVFAGRINPWDACAGFVPLREDQAQCYTTDGGFIKQMGSSVFISVKDHATALVHALKHEKMVNRYIKMSVTQNFTNQSRSWTSARIVGASWPLVVAIVMLVLEEWLWTGMVLVGWLGWFFVSLSAGSDVPPNHRCESSCNTESRRYLLNDQRVTKSLVDYTLCVQFDDDARRKLPKRRTRWSIIRLIGAILMTVHFPIGLVATCYNDSIGALIWILVQFIGLLAGVRWWCREHRLVRHGINYGGGLVIDVTENTPFKTWQEVLNCIDERHWNDIKHKYA